MITILVNDNKKPPVMYLNKDQPRKKFKNQQKKSFFDQTGSAACMSRQTKFRHTERPHIVTSLWQQLPETPPNKSCT